MSVRCLSLAYNYLGLPIELCDAVNKYSGDRDFYSHLPLLTLDLCENNYSGHAIYGNLTVTGERQKMVIYLFT